MQHAESELSELLTVERDYNEVLDSAALTNGTVCVL